MIGKDGLGVEVMFFRGYLLFEGLIVIVLFGLVFKRLIIFKGILFINLGEVYLVIMVRVVVKIVG